MIKAIFEMDKFLQSRPALANNNQNEVTAVIRPRPTDADSDTDSNNDVVVEISLNSSCEVEQVSQDQGNDVSIDDIRPSTSTTGTDNNPWPYLKEFFIYIGLKGNMKNLEYQCLLCKPSCKKLSCSATSMNNLKIHVKRSHPTSLGKFQRCIDDHKAKRKRKLTKESESAQNPAKKKLLQTSITENRQPRPRQEVYENKVSFYTVF